MEGEETMLGKLGMVCVSVICLENIELIDALDLLWSKTQDDDNNVHKQRQ